MATKPQAKPVTKPQEPKPKTELKVISGGPISESRPDFLKKGTGRGTENVTHQDLVIPRLELVQSLSPARNKNHADYIEGAEEGMLYNSVTRELYGDEVSVVPVLYLKEYLVWKDRKKGGGFRGSYVNKSEAESAIKTFKDKDGKPEPADDFAAMDTAQHFCLLITPQGKVQQIVLSMSRSKMKVSRKWNSLIALSDDDSFAKAYKVSSVGEQNQQKQDYYNFKVTPAGYVNEAIFTAAEKLYEMIKKGGVRADTSGLDAEEEGHTAPVDSKDF